MRDARTLQIDRLNLEELKRIWENVSHAPASVEAADVTPISDVASLKGSPREDLQAWERRGGPGVLRPCAWFVAW